MLDSQTALLLGQINALCADDLYTIADREELLRAYPSASMPSAEETDGMIAYLKENRYIDVRYADKARGVYCLRPLPAGRSYAASVLKERAAAGKTVKKMLLAAFAGGFAGALLGAGMVAAIIAFIG